MSELRVITIDGPAGCAKTTVGNAMVDALWDEHDTAMGIAGNFYRNFAALGVRELGERDAEHAPEPARLERLAHHIINECDIYGDNDEDDWADISGLVEKRVSDFGRLPIVQEAADVWWSKVTLNALDTDKEVLVLDGRNPRDRIGHFIKNGSVISALDLMVDCSIPEAARRFARKDKPANYLPSAEELAAAEAHITARRQKDEKREINPFVMPETMLEYAYPLMPSIVAIVASHEYAEEGLPATIHFDTTNMPFEPMKQRAADLASTAAAYVPRQSLVVH